MCIEFPVLGTGVENVHDIWSAVLVRRRKVQQHPQVHVFTLFPLAHAHHGYESFVMRGGTWNAFKTSVIGVGESSLHAWFLLRYTSWSSQFFNLHIRLFLVGFVHIFSSELVSLLSSEMVLSSSCPQGSLAVPCGAHIFCNIMGVPHIMHELKTHPRHRQSTCLRSRSILWLLTLLAVPRVKA